MGKNEKNKIAFIGNPTIGTGLWRYAYETKKQLDRITTNIDEVNLDYQSNTIKVNGKIVLYLKKLWLDYKYFWYLRNQSKIPFYPLYHIANQNLSFLKIFPKIITVYDIFHVSNPRSILEKLLGLFMYSGIPEANHIIAGSEYTKKEIIKHYRIDPSKITTIYAGVSDSYFHADKLVELKRIKKEYSLPDDIPVFLHISNEQKHKNFDKIIKALYILKSKKILNNFLLIKIGKPQYKNDRSIHLKLIDKYSLNSNVKFTGFVPDEDLPYFYKIADIFLFPSEREGFGLPVIEAMASECPVITSNTSSLPEVAGDAAIQIDPRDVNELAKTIELVTKDKKLRKSLIEKGLINARKFTWEKTALATLSIYETSLKKTYV